MSKSVPYEAAQNGATARDEITKVLRVGFMDDFEKHEVLLTFTQTLRGLGTGFKDQA